MIWSNTRWLSFPKTGASNPRLKPWRTRRASAPPICSACSRAGRGLSPKAFLQAVTLDHARGLLRDSASILDASYELGLSGPGRLHDLFVTHEGMSPGIYKAHGRGLNIQYGFHDCPFGRALILITSEGLAGLAFADHGKEKSALADMTSRWPEATYVENQQATAAYAKRIFESERWKPDQPLKIVFIGTDFEIRVWETLLRIPFGKASTYSDIASPYRQTKSSAGRGCGGRQESHFLRGAVPPRPGKIRRARRLSLGPHPQARHPGLGSRSPWRRDDLQLFVKQGRAVQLALCIGVIRNVAGAGEAQLPVKSFGRAFGHRIKGNQLKS